MKDMSHILDQIDLPVGLRMAVSPPLDPRHLFAEEAAAMTRAVPSRQMEFAGGRVAARRALGCDVALPVTQDRTPLWPEGRTGSISHCEDICLAVAGDTAKIAAVGIDIEPNRPLPTDLADEILSDEDLDDPALATHVFSAKEAVFKAHFMCARRMYGFQALSASLDQGIARFLDVDEIRDLPSALKTDLQFRQWSDAAHIVSLCVIWPRESDI